MSPKTIIVDYGLGNLSSISNMLKRIGVTSEISSDISAVESAERLIVPGVGAFDFGMKGLKERGLIEVLNRKVLEERTRVLGICLGLQLFTKGSEEGDLPGLGWLDAETVRFKASPESPIKIPHMGWSDIELRRESSLFARDSGELRFYFVHSYHLRCSRPEDVVGEAYYGRPFTCAIEKDNIAGVQFHPEKSHRFGMKFMKTFIEGGEAALV